MLPLILLSLVSSFAAYTLYDTLTDDDDDGANDRDAADGAVFVDETAEDEVVGVGSTDDDVVLDNSSDDDTAGDDTIFLDRDTFFDGDYTASVYGGAGDDNISGNVGDTDHISLFGGAGDDVVDGSLMNNISLYGDDGNDVLTTSSHVPSGAGYTVQADGGDGDDRLIHIAPPQVWDANVPKLTGGAGEDVFEIRFDESYETHTDDNGTEYTAWGADGIPVRSNLVILTDFNPDEDAIELDLNIDDPQYTITSATLETGAATRVYSDTQPSDPALPTSETGEETRIIVTYENEAGDEREMVIVVKTPDLTWDNIDFVGAHTPAVLQVS